MRLAVIVVCVVALAVGVATSAVWYRNDDEVFSTDELFGIAARLDVLEEQMRVLIDMVATAGLAATPTTTEVASSVLAFLDWDYARSIGWPVVARGDTMWVVSWGHDGAPDTLRLIVVE